MCWLIIFLNCPFFYCNAQGQEDTIRAQQLTEAVVEGRHQQTIDYGVAYTPSKQIKSHSINVVDMLSRMMVAGLYVDIANNKVETTFRKDVHFFIDGAEASEIEIKALRPKDVLRVEYLQSPASPKYKNYLAVINFIIRRHTYGGYVLAEANQSFLYNSGDYGISTKVDYKKWTFQGFAESYYKNAKDIVFNQETQYIFSPTNIANRLAEENKTEKARTNTAVLHAKYNSDKFLFSVSMGVRAAATPDGESRFSIDYEKEGVTESTNGYSQNTSKSTLPYVSTYFQLSGLPNKSMLYGAASVSYNHNTASNLYATRLLETPLFNGSRENVWLPRAWVAYAFPVYKRNYLSVSFDWSSEFFKTRYSGTNESVQKLTNNNYCFRVRYNHSLSKSWIVGGLLEIPVNSYKVNSNKYETTPYINGSLTLNGRVGQKHSIYATAQIAQLPITPQYYNSVVRQDNELAGSKGNSNLKSQRSVFSTISYSWMPVNQFSLNSSLNWESILNDIVPYWHVIGDLMVNDHVNNGDYNIVSATMTPSVSLLRNKLRLQSMFYYAREMHSGLFDLSFDNFGISPSAGFYLNSHLSFSANYNKYLKGYMRGSSYISRFNDNLRLTVQYTRGNFYASLAVNSIFRKNGWVKSALESANVHDFQYISRPWDGRYVNLTLRYTFDFGKKTQHGNNMDFEGSSKTSVL